MFNKSGFALILLILQLVYNLFTVLLRISRNDGRIFIRDYIVAWMVVDLLEFYMEPPILRHEDHTMYLQRLRTLKTQRCSDHWRSSLMEGLG